MSQEPHAVTLGVEYIAGGVVADADGNIIDDTSHRAAQARLAELGIKNLLEEEDNNG